MLDRYPQAGFGILLATLMTISWMSSPPPPNVGTHGMGHASPEIERTGEQGPEPDGVREGELVLSSLSEADALDPDEEEWIQLFNGRDLEGWAVKIRGHDLDDNFGDTFRVEDGVLKVAYEQYDHFNDRFGHLFTRERHSYYIVAVEYRFVGDQAPGGPDWAIRNSGVMVHSQSAASMGKDQDFPISIEVQLLGGTGSGERPTANLCTPGTHVEMHGELVTDHCTNSDSETYHGDEWVRVETLVLGDSLIRHMVEGKTVLEYGGPQIGGGVVSNFDPAEKQDGKRLTEGHIALQSESHPIEFRKVELLNLVGCMDPVASNYKSYYVHPDADACRYDPDR